MEILKLKHQQHTFFEQKSGLKVTEQRRLDSSGSYLSLSSIFLSSISNFIPLSALFSIGCRQVLLTYLANKNMRFQPSLRAVNSVIKSASAQAHNKAKHVMQLCCTGLSKVSLKLLPQLRANFASPCSRRYEALGL